MQSNIKSTVRARSRLPRPIIALGQLFLAVGSLAIVLSLLWMVDLDARPVYRQDNAALTTQPRGLVDIMQRLYGIEDALSRLWSRQAEAAMIQTRTGSRLGARTATDDPPTLFQIIPHWDGYGAIEMSPRGPYSLGQTVNLFADAAPEWRFERWSGAIVGTQNPTTVTIAGLTEVTATFRSMTGEDFLYITTNTVGSGQVVVMPSGPYRVGQAALLTATPSPNWRFLRWSGDIGDADNPFVLTVNDDFEVVALFAMINPPPTITLAVGVEGEGEVTVEPFGPYTVGQTVTLTATPTADWDFGHWRGDLTGATNPYSFTITANTVAIAKFDPIELDPPPPPTLTVQVEGYGEVQVSPVGPYTVDQTITLSAAPHDGWRFAGWNGDLNGATNPLSFTLNASASVTATFEPLPVLELNVKVVGEGSVLSDPPAPLRADQRITLTAQPADDWLFAGWSGDLSGSQNPHTFTLTQNVTVTATFTPKPDGTRRPALTIRLEGPGQVHVEPPGPYEAGQQVTLAAVADEDACFQAWQGGLEGNEELVTVVMHADLMVTAEFGPCPLLLPLVTSP